MRDRAGAPPERLVHRSGGDGRRQTKHHMRGSIVQQPPHGRHHIEPDRAAEAAVLKRRLRPFHQPLIAEDGPQNRAVLQQIVEHGDRVRVAVPERIAGGLAAERIEGGDEDDRHEGQTT